MPIEIGEKFNIIYLCIVQFSLILCLTGVQMYILTPTIKLALSDVVFLQDKSWRLRGCYMSLWRNKISLWVSNTKREVLYLQLIM